MLIYVSLLLWIHIDYEVMIYSSSLVWFKMLNTQMNLSKTTYVFNTVMYFLIQITEFKSEWND